MLGFIQLTTAVTKRPLYLTVEGISLFTIVDALPAYLRDSRPEETSLDSTVVIHHRDLINVEESPEEIAERILELVNS